MIVFLAILFFLYLAAYNGFGIVQVLLGYDKESGQFNIWTAVGAWLGVYLLYLLVS